MEGIDEMYNIERQQKILEIIMEKKCVSVHTLAEKTFTSESTVRRDLKLLEGAGRIRRTFGGAVLEETLTKEVPYLLRKSQNNSAKKEIARQASRCISNGKIIFLDASTTVSYLVPFLCKFQDLTIITNSPQTSVMLGQSGIKNYCTGGLLLENSLAYIGRQAEDFVSHINADLMFFSSRGISEDGVITDSSMEESHLRNAMMAHARKRYFMCDASKIGKTYLYTLCSCHEIDGIFSDGR